MIDTASALFILTAVCAVLVVGISKSGFGAAFGSLAVPLLALVTTLARRGPVAALAAGHGPHGPGGFRRSFDRQLLKLLFPPAMLGIAIGSSLSARSAPKGSSSSSGWFRCCSCCSAGSHPIRSPASRHDATRGRLWGTLSGFTSFIAHAGGPPVSMYLIPEAGPATLRRHHRLAVCRNQFFEMASLQPPGAVFTLYPQAGALFALAAPWGTGLASDA